MSNVFKYQQLTRLLEGVQDDFGIDSPEAERILDELDTIWYQMSEEEVERYKALSRFSDAVTKVVQEHVDAGRGVIINNRLEPFRTRRRCKNCQGVGFTRMSAFVAGLGNLVGALIGKPVKPSPCTWCNGEGSRLEVIEGIRSAEEVFADEWARLDKEDPGWDRDGKVAACADLLRSGMSYEILIAAYGEDILRDAQQEEADRMDKEFQDGHPTLKEVKELLEKSRKLRGRDD